MKHWKRRISNYFNTIGWHCLFLLLTCWGLRGEDERRNAGSDDPLDPGIRLYNRGSLSLYTENDKYFGGTDKFYTNGAQITYLTPELGSYEESRADQVVSWVPSFLPWLANKIPRFGPEPRTVHMGVSLAQYMFTASDITDPSPPPDDRPYAGWLNVGFHFYSKKTNQLDAFEINVGVVGPASLAEETQKFVHDVINAPKPRGWDTQMRNEPTLNLFYDRKFRFEREISGNLEMDAMANAGFALGNAHIHGNVGFEFRTGWNLPRNFGTALMGQTGSPPLPLEEFYDPDSSLFHRFGVHVFAGMDGRYVVRNLFLDGNTYKNSRSVDKENWVGSFRTGVGLHYRRLQFTYTMVHLSREFKTQAVATRYGSIALSIAL